METAKEFFKKYNPLLFDVMERWEDTKYITNIMKAYAEQVREEAFNAARETYNQHITVVVHEEMPGVTISPTEFDTTLNTYSNYTDYKEKNELE